MTGTSAEIAVGSSLRNDSSVYINQGNAMKSGAIPAQYVGSPSAMGLINKRLVARMVGIFLTPAEWIRLSRIKKLPCYFFMHQ